MVGTTSTRLWYNNHLWLLAQDRGSCMVELATAVRRGTVEHLKVTIYFPILEALCPCGAPLLQISTASSGCRATPSHAS